MKYHNGFGYTELANKIIIQACQDYVNSYKYREEVRSFFCRVGLLN